MKIVLGTVSSVADYNGECDFALVALTPDYGKQILSRMKAVLALADSDKSLHEAHYWDGHICFFKSPAEEVFDELLDPARDSYVVLDEVTQLPEGLIQTVEYPQAAIHVRGGDAEITWRASLKNVSVYVESNPLPQSLIEEAAAGRQPIAT
jgi:hypothetical protein